MNPLIKGVCKNTSYLNNVFDQRLSHLNVDTVFMFFFRYGKYCGKRDEGLIGRYNLHNRKYSMDLKEIQNYQKVFAERTWKVEQVKYVFSRLYFDGLEILYFHFY